MKGYKILNQGKYFSWETLENHLIFFLYRKYFRFITNTFKVLSWLSIGLSEEGIENITISDRNFAPTLINYYPLPDIKYNRRCLINNNKLIKCLINK